MMQIYVILAVIGWSWAVLLGVYLVWRLRSGATASPGSAALRAGCSAAEPGDSASAKSREL